MKYTGIDLHSNNSVISVINEADKVVAEKRLPNDLARILEFLEPHKADMVGVVVESTYYKPRKDQQETLRMRIRHS